MNKIILNIDPTTFTGSAIVIGFLLVNTLDNDEQDSIGNWLQLVGLVMQTYASQVTTVQSGSSDDTNNKEKSSDITTIKDAINKINKKLEELDG